MSATEKGALRRNDASSEVMPLAGGEGVANAQKEVNAVPRSEKLAIFQKADGKGEPLPEAITGKPGQDAEVVGPGTEATAGTSTTRETTSETQPSSELRDRHVESTVGNDTRVKVDTGESTVTQTATVETTASTGGDTDRLASALTGNGRTATAGEDEEVRARA